jgi:hypothetical protein
MALKPTEDFYNKLLVALRPEPLAMRKLPLHQPMIKMEKYYIAMPLDYLAELNGFYNRL